MAFPYHLLDKTIRAALDEDLGLAGDITTNAIIAIDAKSEANIVVRENGCLAGLPLALSTFRALDPELSFIPIFDEGTEVEAGAIIVHITGRTRALLSGERVALNFIQRMSGIATMTRRFVSAVKGTNAQIVCTRKTTPGLRAFEKYAVRAGGGSNHRYGLFDAVLIKDNHIAAAGGIAAAIGSVRRSAGHLVKIEVEVDTIEQLDEALTQSVDAVLLDNMAIPELTAAVARAKAAKPGILCEASGGVRLETVRAIAETGVDLISAGGLTHSVSSLDIGLDF